MSNWHCDSCGKPGESSFRARPQFGRFRPAGWRYYYTTKRAQEPWGLVCMTCAPKLVKKGGRLE